MPCLPRIDAPGLLGGLFPARAARFWTARLARQAASKNKKPAAASFKWINSMDLSRGRLKAASACWTYSGLMFDAAGPFWPCVTSKETFWPSFSDL
jgi:hypothetical protein